MSISKDLSNYLKNLSRQNVTFSQITMGQDSLSRILMDHAIQKGMPLETIHEMAKATSINFRYPGGLVQLHSVEHLAEMFAHPRVESDDNNINTTDSGARSGTERCSGEKNSSTGQQSETEQSSPKPATTE